MSSSDDSIRALRQALEFSPDNVPLRNHLAKTLVEAGRLGEAEDEVLSSLRVQPNDGATKLLLGDIYYQSGKLSQAIVVLEDLIKNADAPAETGVLYSRVLLANGDVEASVRAYREAVSRDQSVKDQALADQLGVHDIESVDDEPSYHEHEIVDGKIRQPLGEGFDDDAGELERPQVNFSDVGGMEDLKEEISIKIIHPLKHQELFAAYGKPIGGGILMYGPPGCGKTHLARATAGQIESTFMVVGISDVLDMWIGSSERNLQSVFARARRNAPCVLFFDEVDALGAKRSDMRGSANRQMINQFLSELDGVDANNEGLLILAATNAPWHLDSAFRRPGRFDRILFVPPPDELGRAEILRVLCQDKPTEAIDYPLIAKKTDRFSGADLKAVVDQAIEGKLREAMKSGVPTPIRTKDLVKAAKATKPTTHEWFSTARNHAVYSNEGGLYDDVLKYLKLS